MFGRETRSLLPSMVKQETSDQDFIDRRARRKESVKKSHDRRAKDLTPLYVGQPVYFKHMDDSEWTKGEIQAKDKERSFTLKSDSGGVYRRNRVHIRSRTSQPQSNEPEQFEDIDFPSVPNDVATNVSPEPDVQEQMDTGRPKRDSQQPGWMKDFVCK